MQAAGVGADQPRAVRVAGLELAESSLQRSRIADGDIVLRSQSDRI
jgi:hypothetical protein